MLHRTQTQKPSTEWQLLVTWLELELDADELLEGEGNLVNTLEDDHLIPLKDHMIRFINTVVGHGHPSIECSSHTMLSTMYLERNGFTDPNLLMVHLVHIYIRGRVSLIPTTDDAFL